MAHVAVTLEYDGKTIDLALPMNIPSQELVESLKEALELGKGPKPRYFLEAKAKDGNRRIPENSNLEEMAILHGMTLALVEETKKKALVKETGLSLQVENGPNIPLSSKKVLIGRYDPNSEITLDIDLTPFLPDPRIVSRKHAQIDREGGKYYLTDLGSVNGTRLNGVRIPTKERCELNEGDVIILGKNGVQLTFLKKE